MEAVAFIGFLFIVIGMPIIVIGIVANNEHKERLARIEVENRRRNK